MIDMTKNSMTVSTLTVCEFKRARGDGEAEVALLAYRLQRQGRGA